VGRIISSLTNGKLVFVADFGAVCHCTVHMHYKNRCSEREPTLPPLASKGEDQKNLVSGMWVWVYHF
jgi:hypothetical protein